MTLITTEPALRELLELNDESFLHKAYELLLGRPADIGGFTNFINLMRSGVPKISILGHIINSIEAEKRTEIPQGLRWAIKTLSEQAVVKQVKPANSLDLLLSESTNECFVKCAYLTLLGRPPEPSGEIFFVNQLNSGITRIEVLDQISEAPEAQNHNCNLAGLREELRPYKLRRSKTVGSMFKEIEMIVLATEALAARASGEYTKDHVMATNTICRTSLKVLDKIDQIQIEIAGAVEKLSKVETSFSRRVMQHDARRGGDIDRFHSQTQNDFDEEAASLFRLKSLLSTA